MPRYRRNAAALQQFDLTTLQAAQSEADSGQKNVADLTRAASVMRDKAVAARREVDRLRAVVNAAQSGTRCDHTISEGWLSFLDFLSWRANFFWHLRSWP